MRIRIRYTLEGRTRFVSARDLTSVWERALRRADLPIAYSEGFTPHPKVSFPDALPVGVASTGEYAELTFAAPIDPGPGMAALSATLPEGMDILTFMVVPDGAPKLARMLRATLWELEWRGSDADTASDVCSMLRTAADRLLAADVHEVVRSRGSGDTTVDVRAPLVALAVSPRQLEGAAFDDAAPGPIQQPVLRAVLRNDGPTVRPTDLWTALSDLIRPPAADGAEPRLHRRVAQGEVDPEGLREALSGHIEPLHVDRLVEAA
ncbi:MAG: TIGR03936 family radical SAM-associated protein [Nitriliruptorales bacterium]|nr:TIGR03936 family radical SAM-associated protein [Nitriliruptorales bacterium]